jgi:PPOX class probable F420-dependent enzyme
MDVEAAREFVRHNHRGVLATFRRDGRPQISPVLAVVDGDGRIVISTREVTAKARNLRRDPRASVTVFTDRFFGDWVQLEGVAEIISLPEAMEPLVDYYRRGAGEHPDWAEYRRAMIAERRCLIRISVARAGPATLLD